MSGGPVIRTDRLELRWLTPDDASLMYAIWNSPDFIRHVGDRNIRTLDDASDALAEGALRSYSDLGYGPFRVGLRDGTAIGICGLFKRDDFDAPDIGYAILPPWYRQGYAFEAASAVLGHCDDTLRLDRILAIVSPDNAPSVLLLKKLGMRRVEGRSYNESTVDIYERRRLPGDDA